MASNGLTEEQKRRMEANRLKAIQIREAKQRQQQQSQQQQSFNGQAKVSSTKGPWATPTVMNHSASATATISRPQATSKLPTTPKPPATAKPPATQAVSQTQNLAVKRKAESSYFKQPVTRVKIVLDSHNTLAIQFSYREDIIKLIKTMITSRYNVDARKWTIGISDYSNFLNALKTIGDSVQLDADSVPARVVSLIESHMKYRDVPVDLLEKFDQEFIDNLFPFQREGIKFGIQRDGKCLLADDMGLGKTVQALGIVAWFRQDWPVCIACPASVTVSWKQAILRWLGKWVREHEIELLDTKEPSYGSKFYIGSYERLGKCADEFVRRRVTTIILDECHNIKSDAAKRTLAALKISKVARHVILISGTPALSRPIELYTQLAALNENLFNKKHDFGLRYCNARPAYQKGPKQAWDYRGHSNTDELRILLESTVMIRRLKADVLRDLPNKSRIVINLPLKITEEERIELDKVKAKVSNRNHFHSDNADLMAWYRETSRLKVTAVLDYLERKIDRTGKIICFAHHRVMIDAIADFLSRHSVKHIIITGDTPANIRQSLCDDFQNTPTTKVALISILAAGVGITLTAANLVIFTELTWNPGVLTQAEDRAHRIGQEENVTIEYLVSPDTCDEHIWSLIQTKLAVLGKVGLSKDVMKDSAQRDANQSVIEDFFSPKSKAKAKST